MRDLLEVLFHREPIDPMTSARRGLRASRAKRFYREVGVGTAEGGFSLLLDGRQAKTPGGRKLIVPTRPLADALVAEWDAQREEIDPARMPLTRLANTVIDGVAQATDEVAGEVAQYLGSDLLCYRADAPEGLTEQQARLWDPVLDWARSGLGARFILAEGVVFVAQPAHAVEAAAAAIPRDPWRLGAVAAITSLTGSALLALAVAQNALSIEQAWEAAHVDEEWNMASCGRDELAMARRAARFEEMQAAAATLRLLG